MSQSPELATLLRAGSVLLHTDSQPQASDLKAVLSSRLAQHRALRGLPEHDYSSASQDDLQRATALEALFVVERVQQILDSEVVPLQNPSSSPASSASPRRYNENTPGETPLIGTRDISQLRTLLSIAFKWGIDPLLARVQSAWPSKTSQSQREASHSSPRIIDLTGIPEDYTFLISMLRRAMSLLFPQGVNGKIPQTLITAAVLNRHVTDLLGSGIALGWIPKSLATADTPVVDEMRAFVMKLLSMCVIFFYSLIWNEPVHLTHYQASSFTDDHLVRVNLVEQIHAFGATYQKDLLLFTEQTVAATGRRSWVMCCCVRRRRRCGRGCLSGEVGTCRSGVRNAPSSNEA